MLANKVVFITGGTGSIGRSMVEVFSNLNAVVYFSYCSEKEKAENIIDDIESRLGKRVIALRMDGRDFDVVHATINEIVMNEGRIDILVNNLGINRDSMLFWMSPKDWEDVMRVNLGSIYNCSKAVLAPMMRQRKGKIINISSVSGLKGIAGQCNYSTTKAGIIGFTKTLSRETGKFGINVNCIAPGFIDSNMTDKLNDDTRKKYIEQIPLKRFGTANDVANLAVFLASEYSDYITGEVIVIDGGMSS